MANITLTEITKHFGNDVAVHPLDIEIADGTFTVLVGPSGCGKTTTLRMLAGLVAPTTGTLMIDGIDVTEAEPKDRNISMVFQNYALYPHLDVARNIGFPLAARKEPKRTIKDKVGRAASMLGIEHLLDRKPSALSGGQQQRVAIARAIVRDPSVFLFDEPLSNLDAKLRVETRTELLRLQRRLHATMVYVTHDQEEAMILADDLIVMSEGRIMQRGEPTEIFRRPVNEFVARFIGSPEINLFDAFQYEGTLTTDLFTVPIASAESRDVRLGVRPDDVRRRGDIPEARAVGAFSARVDVVQQLGSSAVLYLEANGQEIRAVVPESELEDINEGDSIEMALDAYRLHLFDPDTGARLDHS